MVNAVNAAQGPSHLLDSISSHAKTEHTLDALRKQLRVLRATAIQPLAIDRADLADEVSPHVFLLNDGRVLEWFGESRPYVVHPCLDDLYRMRRLQPDWHHAA